MGTDRFAWHLAAPILTRAGHWRATASAEGGLALEGTGPTRAAALAHLRALIARFTAEVGDVA